MTSGALLLREADALLGSSQADLVPLAARGWRGSFGTGAEWMREALTRLRGGRQPEGIAPFQKLGLLKYAAACAAALVWLPAVWFGHWMLIFMTVPAFYAVEVQWVFLFPAALDGSPSPWRDSRALMHRHTGTLGAVFVVLPLAWRMLTGGLRGQGFVRSWCAGCLAVLLWYEKCRAVPLAMDSADALPRLDIGGQASLLVRREQIALPVKHGLKILYASDLHVRNKGDGVLLDALGAMMAQTSTDAVVLGGDLADTYAGLATLAPFIRLWTAKTPVLVVPGNHDHWLGIEHVRATVLDAKAVWLPDGPFLLHAASVPALWLAALSAWPVGGPTPVVACLHDPAEFPQAVNARARLALAGHLHGCQFVFGENAGRLLPGAWFYRWNVLRAVKDDCPLLVSRGCQDTWRIRWNCPREALLCEIRPSASVHPPPV